MYICNIIEIFLVHSIPVYMFISFGRFVFIAHCSGTLHVFIFFIERATPQLSYWLRDASMEKATMLMLLSLIYCPCSIFSFALVQSDKKNISHFRCCLRFLCGGSRCMCVNATALDRNCSRFLLSIWITILITTKLHYFDSPLKCDPLSSSFSYILHQSRFR